MYFPNTSISAFAKRLAEPFKALSGGVVDEEENLFVLISLQLQRADHFIDPKLEFAFETDAALFLIKEGTG